MALKLDIIYTRDSAGEKGIKILPDNSIDLLCTDPPYGLISPGKQDKRGFRYGEGGKKTIAANRGGFMGLTWDQAIPSVEIWKECLRVLKPGAFAFVMCIPRQDCLSRMIISLEDAGFNVGFTSMFHAFASGFPKAQNISKAVDKRLGVERKVIGQKVRGDVEKAKRNGTTFAAADANKNNKAIFGYGIEDLTLSATPQAQALDGSYSYNPKPAVEIVIVAQKPKTTKTYVDQALLWYEERQEVLRGLATELKKCYSIGKVEWEN